MEHVNSPAATLCQDTQQEQHQPQSQQQQFCLRWHNHQTSLLSTLPILLDQSQLTDVTISAEGRTLRAHRVVLSACSSFFLELFRALDAASHPIIIIPGATFSAIVALLTFMYSGEVNVYEEQIPMLLSLAETLGIKGLADVQHNLQRSSIKQHAADYFEKLHAEQEQEQDQTATLSPATTPPTPSTPPTPPIICHTPRPTQTPISLASSAVAHSTSATSNAVTHTTPHPTANSLFANKLASTAATATAATAAIAPTAANCSPLENLFLKSLQFYPNLLPQPLNFSQTALNKTSELLAKYQQYQGNLAKDFLPLLCSDDYGTKFVTDDGFAAKRFCCGPSNDKRQQQLQQHFQLAAVQQPQHNAKDQKRLDKIVENLRGTSTQHNKSHHTNDNGSSSGGNSQHNNNNNSSTHLKLLTNAAQHAEQLQHYSSNHGTPTAAGYAGNAHLSPQLAAQKLFAFGNAKSPQHQQLLSNATSLAEHLEDTKQKLQQSMELYASCSRSAAAQLQAAEVGKLDHANSNNSSHMTAATLSESKLPTGTAAGAAAATAAGTAATPPSPQTKQPSNSKLYATCFICHKQLSNQYNLRVHLETHQNVRYACNVCSHVSRSKDALRKHVSYRHPGAPSPCENEARRKRATKTALNSLLTLPCNTSANTSNTSTNTSSGTISTATTANASNANATTTTSATPMDGFAALNSFHAGNALNSSNNNNNNSNSNADTLAAQLSSAYMLLPKQFHLAAAAAAVAQHQQQQQQQQLKNELEAGGAAAATSTSDASAATNATTTNTTTATTVTSSTSTANSAVENHCARGVESPVSPKSPTTPTATVSSSNNNGNNNGNGNGNGNNNGNGNGNNNGNATTTTTATTIITTTSTANAVP